MINFKKLRYLFEWRIYMAATVTGDPIKQPKCAFCKRWKGDANLTNKGVPKGKVKFESSAKGICTANGNHIPKTAINGANCRDYEISTEAYSFV